jgi:hypothetical protein
LPWADLVQGELSRRLLLFAAISTTFASAPTPQQSRALEFLPSTSWLYPCCGIDIAASIWDPGSSRFTYLRRQILPHLQVVGVLLLQRLHQPALNRRFVRGLRPVVSVCDASANPRRRLLHPHRHEQSRLLPAWSQDLFVIRSSLEDLIVIWPLWI